MPINFHKLHAGELKKKSNDKLLSPSSSPSSILGKRKISDEKHVNEDTTKTSNSHVIKRKKLSFIKEENDCESTCIQVHCPLTQHMISTSSCLSWLNFDNVISEKALKRSLKKLVCKSTEDQEDLKNEDVIEYITIYQNDEKHELLKAPCLSKLDSQTLVSKDVSNQSDIVFNNFIPVLLEKNNNVKFLKEYYNIIKFNTATLIDRLEKKALNFGTFKNNNVIKCIQIDCLNHSCCYVLNNNTIHSLYCWECYITNFYNIHIAPYNILEEVLLINNENKFDDFVKLIIKYFNLDFKCLYYVNTKCISCKINDKFLYDDVLSNYCLVCYTKNALCLSHSLFVKEEYDFKFKNKLDSLGLYDNDVRPNIKSISPCSKCGNNKITCSMFDFCVNIENDKNHFDFYEQTYCKKCIINYKFYELIRTRRRYKKIVYKNKQSRIFSLKRKVLHNRKIFEDFIKTEDVAISRSKFCSAKLNEFDILYDILSKNPVKNL